MKIYWYWPHPHRTAHPLAQAMLRAGDTLTVQALPSLRGEAFADIEEYEVVRDLPDPTVEPGSFVARRLRPVLLTVRRSRARARLVRRGFDVAHIENLVYQGDWLDLRRLRRKVALVSSVHDVRPHEPRLPARLERALLAELYRSAGHLVVLHSSLGDELVGDFGVPAERVHVLPHPFASTGPATGRRGGEDPASDRPVLLFFGTLRGNKGLEVLLDAVQIAGPELAADVVIAGGGSPAIEALVEERASRLPNVRVEIGYVPPERKRELFAEATCVVLPYTRFHSQSGVLADAYACRMPLIVSDVGALGGTVRDDGTGLVVPPGDAAALAEALLQAPRRDDVTIQERLDRAAHDHDYQVVGRRLRAIYDTAYADS